MMTVSAGARAPSTSRRIAELSSAWRRAGQVGRHLDQVVERHVGRPELRLDVPPHQPALRREVGGHAAVEVDRDLSAHVEEAADPGHLHGLRVAAGGGRRVRRVDRAPDRSFTRSVHARECRQTGAPTPPTRRAMPRIRITRSARAAAEVSRPPPTGARAPRSPRRPGRSTRCAAPGAPRPAACRASSPSRRSRRPGRPCGSRPG